MESTKHPVWVIIVFRLTIWWFRSLEKVLSGSAETRYIKISKQTASEIKKQRLGLWSGDFSMMMTTGLMVLLIVGASIPVAPALMSSGGSSVVVVVFNALFFLQLGQWLTWVLRGPELFYYAESIKKRPSVMFSSFDPSIYSYLRWCLVCSVLLYALAILLGLEPFPFRPQYGADWLRQIFTIPPSA